MASTYRLHSSYDRPPVHRRVSGIGLALLANALLLLALLTLDLREVAGRMPSDALIVELLPEAQAPEAQTDRTQVPRRAEFKPTRPRPPVPPAPVIPERPIKLDMIEMTREQYRAADISRFPQGPADAGTAIAAAGDSAVVGRGPNGEDLYAAEWARRPTDAELAGYIPKNAPEGWGLVACRTVPGNRVEDCVELDNHPRGSRLAAAVRQAAWQFRVKPPRKGGRLLIGSWVRIRIDYSRGPKEDS